MPKSKRSTKIRNIVEYIEEKNCPFENNNPIPIKLLPFASKKKASPILLFFFLSFLG